MKKTTLWLEGFLVIHDELGKAAGLQRLTAVGPIWVWCCRQQVIKNQLCGYSDEWGLRVVLIILLDTRELKMTRKL